jgi:putative aldouronate transport system substrate-binding protein
MTKYLSDNMKKMAGKLLDACTVNGDIYAYPGNLYPGTALSLVYDKDLADKYNIKLPDKISSQQDMENIFEQVKKSGMSQYPLSISNGQNTEWCNGADYDDLGDSTNLSYGVVMGADNAANKIVDWYESDTYKSQCDLRKSWNDKGYILPDSISNNYSNIDSMTQGTVFSMITNIGTGSSVGYWSAQTHKNLVAIPMKNAKITAGGTVNLSWGISSTCKDPQKVCDFLELLYTDTDLANLLSYGMKDVHYTTQEGSRIVKYPDGVTSSTVGYGNFIGPFGDSSKIYFREPLTDEFANSVVNYGVEKSELSKYLSYSFDPKNVKAEVAAVNTVIGKYGPSLACGVVDVDATLSKFRQELKDAGIDKIIAENQKQMDAWASK